jgi:hypothetical protein
MKGTLLILGAALLVLAAALLGGPILQRNQRAGEMRALRTQLNQARSATVSCRSLLASEEDSFLRFDRVVDSLRGAVQGYEDPEQGGVPQAQYQEYLESFDLYNSSVEEWQIRADSLQAMEDHCRAVIEAYNRLGDSIRSLQESYGEGSS